MGLGKSVTMQSFIPLLLDGKKTPERLDPFGNKARKIEDYVLGYGDDIKDENTSYLYMEFVNNELKTYRTIGMGIRGKRGQGVKFWGFVIKDGRRVSKDILLYKDKSNKIPLTKVELKNRLGEGGEIVETQKEYASLVNDNIFGFESLEEYDEFIKLLIEIRTPKLSNGKTFRPSTVLEILSNSLRPLSDEDLRPVSESIDNMNKTKEQLQFLKQSKKAIDKIKSYYDEYNKYLVYSKAKRYKDESKKYQNNKIELENLNIYIENKENELKNIKSKIEDLEAKIEAVNLQEETLRNSKAWNVQKELVAIEESLKELLNNISQKEERLENNKREERKIEEQVRNSNDEIDIYLKEFEDLNYELQELAKSIEFQEYFFTIEEIKENVRKKYDFTHLQNEIKRYIEKIETAKKALQKLRELERVYDEAQQQLEMVKNTKANQDLYVTKLRLARDEEKSKMIDNVYLWEKQNEILKLVDDEKVKLVQKIENYPDTANYDDIIATLRIPFSKIHDDISKELVTLRYKMDEISNEIKEKQEEKQQWQKIKDPEPFREDAVILNRKKLEEANINFVPFYQAVDFNEDIDESLKGVLEAALIDMGILDALIIKKEDLDKALKIDVGFVDKYLVANPVDLRYDLTSYLTVSLAEDSKISKTQVMDILKTILIADKSSQNYLDEDGIYQIGLLKGQANKNYESKFIGEKSRKKYRQNKVNELEENIASLENDKLKIVDKIEYFSSKLDKLNDEFNNFPSRMQIEEKDNELKIAIQKLEAIKQEIETKQSVLNEKYNLLKQAKLDSQEQTQKLPFNPKLETYEQVEEFAKELKENIYELEKIQNNLVNAYQKQLIYEENLENVRDVLDNLLYEINHMQAKQKCEEEKKLSLSKILEEEGKDLIKQMDECLRLKRELPLKKDEAVKLEGSIETDIQNKKEKSLILEQKVNISKRLKEMAKDILQKEVNLGYIYNNDKKQDSIEVVDNLAKDILKEYVVFEKNTKSKSDYLDNFMVQVRMNQEYLVDYNLSIETILNINIQDEDEEIFNLAQTSSRKDITCFVKGRKVDFLTLSKDIDETITITESLIEEDDRRLFEEILTNTVGRKIRERIYHAKEWVKSMNYLMETIDTSSKLSFSLNWKPKVATDDSEIDTKELVDILNADSRILKQEEITKVANHFRTKFAKAEVKSKELSNILSFHDIMKEALDYRTWFEFQFNFKKGSDNKKELTNNEFFKLSGGEKAMAMYIPLFAAVTSKFQSAKATAPRIISLDEAFAGVDDENISRMFGILTQLDLEYIINSQVLWGEYDTIPSLAINELVSDPEAKLVCVIRYVWNGIKRELVVKES